MTSANKSSWFTSTFEGFAGFSSSPQSTRKRRRKEIISDSSHRFAGRPAQGKIDIKLWIDRHQPQQKEDLAVHRKKIDEVEKWLEEALIPHHKQDASLLLLTGPAGCGKSTTVHILGKEMGIEVQEWMNPVSCASYIPPEEEIFRTEYISGDVVKASSQSSLFADFLLRATRYPSLCLLGIQQCDRKLLLVEDFPNAVLRDPKDFHSLLRKYKSISQSPAVFIVTDSTKGESNVRSLFPKDIQEELDIHHISFNPIAQTAVMKVLGKVASCESKLGVRNFTVPQKNTLEALAESSGGDLRSAVNALQFACLKDMSELERAFTGYSTLSSNKSLKSTKVRHARKRREEAEDDSTLAAIGGRDTSLFLFRALGKVLYCKRDVDSGLEYTKLPPHLSQHERSPLIASPEDIHDKTQLTADTFNLFLQQNYIQFFSSIEDVTRASQYMSDADCLTKEWTGRLSMDDYVASVAIRGLMHSNTNPVTRGWRPLHKPQWFSVQKKYREGTQTAKQLFLMPGWSAEEVQTQVLPYMRFTKLPLSPRQSAFLQEIGRFQSLNFVPRSHVELLEECDSGLSETPSVRVGCVQSAAAMSEDEAISTKMDSDDEMKIEDYDED